MARKKLKPVSIEGIEFDALIDEEKTMNSTIPCYPVEDGFPVSDTIILEPLTLQMTLYITNTPVTWLHRHGNSVNRVEQVCEYLENLWLSRKIVKVVTTDAIYTNMGITGISIKKSKEIGYAREVSLQIQKIRITKRKTVSIPSYVLKSGETMANAGTTSTSTTSSSSSATSNSSTTSTSNSATSAVGTASSSASSGSDAKKSQSILYGVATGLDFI